MKIVLLATNPNFSPRFWKGGASRAAEKLESAVILSIDSLAAAQEGQRLGPRKGSVDLLLGPRLFLVRRGRAADLKDSSALRLLNSKDLRVEFLQSAAKNLDLSGFMAKRDSSSPLLQKDSALEFFRQLLIQMIQVGREGVCLLIREEEFIKAPGTRPRRLMLILKP